MEAGYQSTAGIGAERRAAGILARARELSDRTQDPRAIALTAVMNAACAWSTGRWGECYRRAGVARQLLRDCHERVTWERDTAAIFEVEGLRWTGRWSRMKTVLPELLEDARSRGDLYAQAILQMHAGSCADLANDDPGAAHDGLAILEHWSNSGFHVEHLIETHNQIEIGLYAGLGEDALALINSRWPALEHSLLLRVQNFNIQMRSLRARAALGAAAGQAGSSRRTSLRLAADDARAIEREKTTWGRALAELIRGGGACVAGRPADAHAAFERADAASIDAGMMLHSAVARRCRGLLLGGDAGRRISMPAEQEMASEGIVNPVRFTSVIAPGVMAD
jgi:hypothetical protein